MFELPALLSPSRPRKITVVPLVGESISGYTNSYSQINQIVLQVADAFSGTAHFLLSPLLVGSRELCEMLYQDDVARTVVEYWKNLTYACIGIGTVPPVEGEIVYVGEQNLQTFVKAGAIGDICTRYFNQDGQYIHTDLHERTISVQFEHLRSAKHTCVFSAGTGKAHAVYAFLKTGLATELFVDEELAKAILSLYRWGKPE
jgi:DNA-binding transcriptional regulator LsrR (DeoR family)